MVATSVPRVYCINLDRSPHRWRFMRRQFDAMGIDFCRIAAIDGRALDAVQLKRMSDQTTSGNLAKLLTRNAVACAASHVAAYRQFLDDGGEIGVFLEDDVELTEDFAVVLTSLAGKFPPGACVVLVFVGPPKPFSQTKTVPLTDGRSLHQSLDPGLPHSAVAYVLDRKAAQRLVAANTPVKFTSDSWGHFWTNRVISDLFAVLPGIAKPAEFSSDIGYSMSGRIGRIIERALGRPVLAPLRSMLGRGLEMRYDLIDRPQRERPPAA